MIAYSFNHDGATKTVTGANARACANSLFSLKSKLNIPTTLQQCLDEVAKHGSKHVVSVGKAINVPAKKKLGLSEIISGGLALVDIIKGDVASDTEIEQRSLVCADCHLASKTSTNCKGCAGKALTRFSRHLAVSYGRNFIEPTIRHQKEGVGKVSEFYCGFCGCNCLNLILSRSKHFLKKENSTRPKNCWVHNL